MFKSILFRGLTVSAFFSLAYLLLGPAVCRVFVPGGGKRLLTAAKFSNLRVAMSQLSSDFYLNQEDFPADMAGLVADPTRASTRDFGHHRERPGGLIQ